MPPEVATSTRTLSGEPLLATIRSDHQVPPGNRAPSTRRSKRQTLTSVRRPWEVQAGVPAAVHVLALVGQHELLQRTVQEERVTPVDTHRGQVAGHRERGSVLRSCGRELRVMETCTSERV